MDQIGQETVNNNLKNVQSLVNRGVSINKQDTYGRTPLHWAATMNRTVIALFLLDRGADVNVKDKEGQTPLHLASDGGYVAIVDLLLEKNADVNVKDNKGRTAMDLAKSRGYNQAVVKRITDSIKNKAGNVAALALYKSPAEVIRGLKAEEQSLPSGQVRVGKRYTEGEHGKGAIQLPVDVIQNIRGMMVPPVRPKKPYGEIFYEQGILSRPGAPGAGAGPGPVRGGRKTRRAKKRRFSRRI